MKQSCLRSALVTSFFVLASSHVLASDFASDLYVYPADTVFRDLGSPYVVVGGVADHVHILFDMGKVRAPAKFVEQAKRESSKFIKTLGNAYKDFYWQRGYGMFSVGPTRREDVEKYVRNQDDTNR